MAWTTPYTWTAGEEVTAAKLNEQMRDNQNAIAPVGSLHWRMQAATSVETTIDGFGLECNAVSILRATYSALNTKLSGLSYPFGTADGTHMTLPDLRGRTAYAMAASGHADVNAIGDSDGIATVASRTPKPTVSSSVTVTTTASSTGNESAHTHSAGTLSAAVVNIGGRTYFPSGAQTSTEPQAAAVSGVTGAPSAAHLHSVPALSGSGSGSGTVPGSYLVVGVLAVKY